MSVLSYCSCRQKQPELRSCERLSDYIDILVGYFYSECCEGACLLALSWTPAATSESAPSRIYYTAHLRTV
jgi:hypothetical protein